MKRVMCSSLLMLFAIGVGITASPAQTSEKDSAVVEREVREVFDKWSTALGRADKKTYLDTFWNSPKLVIRVAGGEWRGIEAYRKRIEAAQLPPASPSDYKNVEVVALGRDAAVVTYERPAPGGVTGPAGESLIFIGTAVFTRTAEGWKIAAWHAHSVSAKSSAH
ncbi:MAG: AtzH-like domain-containing protein [Acidobacteriota bacterium]